jgi:hypothetical protein
LLFQLYRWKRLELTITKPITRAKMRTPWTPHKTIADFRLTQAPPIFVQISPIELNIIYSVNMDFIVVDFLHREKQLQNTFLFIVCLQGEPFLLLLP